MYSQITWKYWAEITLKERLIGNNQNWFLPGDRSFEFELYHKLFRLILGIDNSQDSTYIFLSWPKLAICFRWMKLHCTLSLSTSFLFLQTVISLSLFGSLEFQASIRCSALFYEDCGHQV